MCFQVQEWKGVMGSFYKLLRLLPAVMLVSGVRGDELSHPYYPLHIKVIRADFHPVFSADPVPKNCDLQNYDGYCNDSRVPSGQHIMVVQDTKGNSYTISCTVDSRWSKCAGLPVGQSFDARKEKGGLTVVSEDSHGRDKKEFYHLVDTSDTSQPAPAAAARPSAGADPQTRPVAASPRSSASGVSATTGAASPPVSSALKPRFDSADSVRCKFTTTPAGADIILDGKYVGNTPSEITLSTSAHSVVFTLPGFVQWKRDLTVLPGSELNVSANLQKEQP